MSERERHTREDNPYAVCSTGGWFDGFGGSGSAEPRGSDHSMVLSIMSELLKAREEKMNLQEALEDLQATYDKLAAEKMNLQEEHKFFAMLLDSDYKIVSITGVMLTTTDDYGGEIKHYNLVPHVEVNGDYLRTSESINGHRVYVKIRGAPLAVSGRGPGAGGRVCIWKSPDVVKYPNQWLVGQPHHYPQHFCMATINVKKEKKEPYYDLAEEVRLAEERGAHLRVATFGHIRRTNRLGEPIKVKLHYQPHACIRPKNVQAVMADLLADADTYAQRLRFNMTTFECVLCACEKLFEAAQISPCGHVFCKDCYLGWLNKSPNGRNTMCPEGCFVPISAHYTPYTFPTEMTLRYVEKGTVKDVERLKAEEAAAEKAAATAATAAALAAAAAAAEAARNAFRPPPNFYDARAWLDAYGFSRRDQNKIMACVIEKVGRCDVWTLLDLREVDIDRLDLMRRVKIELHRAAEGLRKAWEDGAMAQNGTLSAEEQGPFARPFSRPPPAKYTMYSWLTACRVPQVEASTINACVCCWPSIEDSGPSGSGRLRDDVWALLELSAGDIDSMDLTLWQKTLIHGAAAALQEAKDAGVMAQDGTLVQATREEWDGIF